MNEVFLIILAYLIGSIPTSLIVSRTQFNLIFAIMEVEMLEQPILLGS
jgi:glycerol-3-phosphate acyltransferase PlsY